MSARPAERALLPLLLVPMYLFVSSRWPAYEAEMFTYRAAQSPLGDLLATPQKDPPLYLLLEWLMYRVHPSVEMLRVPGLIAAAVTVAVVHDTGERWTGRWSGRLAAIFLAVCPFFTAYAVNARRTTIMALVGAIATREALAVVHDEKYRPAAVRLGVTLGLGFWVHSSSLLAWTLAALAIGLGLVQQPDRLDRAKPAAIALVAPWLALVPWYLVRGGGPSDPSLPVTPTVLRYLLWPVGMDYTAPGAVLLLLLALFGTVVAYRRGLGPPVLGWVIAAIAVPIAWSTGPEAVEYRLYAPLLPAFALAVGMTLSAAATRLPGFLAGFPAVALAALGLVGLRDVLVPESNLVSVAPVVPGIFDIRLEAETIASFRRAIAMKSATSQDWSFYVPQLGSDPTVGVWVALDRPLTAEQWAGYAATVPEGCLITEGFSAFLAIPFPADCDEVRDTARRVGLEQGYGPFLLEAAVGAEKSGDLAAAVDLARAASASPVNARADWMLTRLLLDGGRPEAALDAARAGERKAARYLQRTEWSALVQLEVQAAEKLGDPGKLDAARWRQRCLLAESGTAFERRCEGGWLALL